MSGVTISKETKKMTRRTLTALFSAAICLLFAAPVALAGTPALKLTASSQPTNLAPGEEVVLGGSATVANSTPQYSLIATNVGSAPTSGPVKFTDTLPAGLTPLAAAVKGLGVPGGASLDCPPPSGQTVTCEYPFTLQPNEWSQLIISLKVAVDAAPSLQNQAGVLGGGAAEARTVNTTTISSTPAVFDFLPGSNGLSISTTGVDGAAATQAGSHPAQVTVDIGLPSRQLGGSQSTSTMLSSSYVRDVNVNLPRGMIANPNAATARCTEAQLILERCPNASALGTATILTNLAYIVPETSALYNMVPPPGVAAELAFDGVNTNVWVHLMGGVNSAGEFELGTDTSEILARELNPVFGVQAQLWGNPSDEAHDTMRGICTKTGGSCTLAERTNTPFLTMPSSCSEEQVLHGSAFSWEESSNVHRRSAQVEDSLGNPTGTDGCNQLEFKPTIESKPTTNLSDSPSGLDFKLSIPQHETFSSLAEANLKDAVVTLPAGMALNPSSGGGLGACTVAQIGLTSGIGQTPVHTNANPATCPDAAKIGELEVKTQLLDHPIKGAIYAAKPFENPFGSLLAIYLAIHDQESGVVLKLAGKVDADPQTGQLTASFADNPELPFEEFKLHFFNGPRAALRTPLACNTYATTSTMTPWSTPEGANEHPSDSFAVSVAASGSGACPTSEGAAPNNPSFSAGTLAPQAGAYSPFVLKLSRNDGTQPLAGIDATLPKGLIGKLAGLTNCSEAQIAQAQARNKPYDGAIEQANPSCPASSEVGSVQVSAGAGITPIGATGHAYLAGPYKGAPLSLVVITPAIAGPYDLGAVVVRNALKVDPDTAQVRAISDPFPQIIDGIPLDLRSIEVKLNRPDFTLNPTSCDPKSITGSAISALGSIAPLTSPFQVGGCGALKFAPKLTTRLTGPTTRGGHPALKATFTAKPGEAATAKLSFALPHSEFIDQAHFRTICTRVQFAAKSCPAGSVYGQVKATTPLLDYPLEGAVYLRSSNNKLPDVVLALQGPPSQPVEIDLAGKVDSVNGGIRTTFESLPDAPLTKAVVSLQGGKKGLFQNSTNICAKTNRATLKLDGQNGKTFDSAPAIKVASCKGKARKKAHKGHKAKKTHKGKAHR